MVGGSGTGAGAWARYSTEHSRYRARRRQSQGGDGRLSREDRGRFRSLFVRVDAARSGMRATCTRRFPLGKQPNATHLEVLVLSPVFVNDVNAYAGIVLSFSGFPSRDESAESAVLRSFLPFPFRFNMSVEVFQAHSSNNEVAGLFDHVETEKAETTERADRLATVPSIRPKRLRPFLNHGTAYSTCDERRCRDPLGFTRRLPTRELSRSSRQHARPTSA